jgi:hypothetical protein
MLAGKYDNWSSPPAILIRGEGETVGAFGRWLVVGVAATLSINCKPCQGVSAPWGEKTGEEERITNFPAFFQTRVFPGNYDGFSLPPVAKSP